MSQKQTTPPYNCSFGDGNYSFGDGNYSFGDGNYSFGDGKQLREALISMIPSSSHRRAAFERIKAYFDAYDSDLALNGKLPLGSTDKGFWGVSHLEDVYAFCEKISLDTKEGFIDLGSGDGRVVFVAALFTSRAVGIEYDEALHSLACAARDALGIPVELIRADYTEHSLGAYDVLYTYADHNFRWLAPKITEVHLDATMYCYHDTFHPEGMVKGRTVWVGQLPIFSYTRKTPSSHFDSPQQ